MGQISYFVEQLVAGGDGLMTTVRTAGNAVAAATAAVDRENALIAAAAALAAGAVIYLYRHRGIQRQ